MFMNPLVVIPVCTPHSLYRFIYKHWTWKSPTKRWLWCINSWSHNNICTFVLYVISRLYIILVDLCILWKMRSFPLFIFFFFFCENENLFFKFVFYDLIYVNVLIKIIFQHEWFLCFFFFRWGINEEDKHVFSTEYWMFIFELLGWLNTIWKYYDTKIILFFWMI